ncbi:hypothetical protein [Nocardioides pantholopis]|uniref:hypothetical protein n=1 Tax=Nocardioides pantholopis TaxID=2483798 RepID=UPI000F08512E|nr:hypothetical protein [Nocardioides pantholopis]
MPESPRPSPAPALLRAARLVRARIRGSAPAAPRPTSDPVADPAFARAHWRLGRTLLGEDALPETWTGLRFDRQRVDAMVASARRSQALATHAELLALGAPEHRARAATIRELCRHGLPDDARAFALGAERVRDADPELDAQVGHLASGLVLALAAGRLDLCWAELAAVPDRILAESAPVEAVAAAVADGSEAAAGRAVAVALLAADDPGAEADVLVQLAGRLLVAGYAAQARDLAGRAADRGAELSAPGRDLLENLRRWTHPAPARPAPAGAVSVGVIDYHQPDLDRSSRNVGDYVQTLAMLGNLARFRGSRFTGDAGLGEVATEVQRRVRPDLHLPGGDRDVHLVPVSRDFSVGDPIPPDTWTIAFGWHLHAAFEQYRGLPYHPGINPIFVSFHVNKLEVLDEPTLAYLRAHGPVGCRDWTTVDLLLSAGVDAFFTGCLTTTVDAVFPGPPDARGDRVTGVVDLPDSVLGEIDGPVEVLHHGGQRFRAAGLAEGVRAAVELLEGYRDRFARVVTSRLHSYLPATSLGLEVDFRPTRVGDVRFDGLLGMRPGAPAFEEMRDGIRSLLAEVWAQVLAGADRDAVYACWRERTAPLVDQARRRHADPDPRVPLPAVDLPGVLARVRAESRSHGPAVDTGHDAGTDVATSVDAATLAVLPVTVETMLAHAFGPLRLWVTARGTTPAYEEWFAAAFPGLPVTFLGCGSVDRGTRRARPARRHGVATADRLLLPELLGDVDRLVCLDAGALVLADVAELAATDLGGRPLAARGSATTGAELWRRAGNALSAELAADLRRTMGVRHRFDFTAPDAGVAVWDLARMRADGAAAELVALARGYRLDDQEALTAYVGPAWAELAPRWSLRPALDRLGPDPAGIVQYAGGLAPWASPLAPYGALWREHAARLRARAGEPPVEAAAQV